MSRIDADLKLADAAAERPWRYGYGPLYRWDDGIVDRNGGVVLTNSGHGSTSATEENAAYIVAAANHYSAALRLLKQVRSTRYSHQALLDALDAIDAFDGGSDDNAA